MKYLLTERTLGSSVYIKIDEHEYKKIKTVKNNLLEIFYIEEKFDIFIGNYLEFELDLLKYAAYHMVRGYGTHNELHRGLNQIIRRIINLLSTGRLYLDQSIHNLNNIPSIKSINIEEIKKEKNKQYDQYLGYRAMEALRNYVQHRGYPIQGLTYNNKLVGKDPNEKYLFSITPYIQVQEFEKDNKFKKEVLEEIKRLGEKVDLKPLIREYVEALWNIHAKIRELLKSDILEWEKLFQNTINKVPNNNSKIRSNISLSAVKQNEDGSYVDPIEIDKFIIEYRQELQRKNSTFINLSKRYVTNEVI
jgi:uncharacterized protein with HEPN domain